jgi:hypothetical protein
VAAQRCAGNLSGSFEKMKISLIIPTRSRALYLRETLQTVAVAVQAYKGDVEVVVSDNASDDETAEVCAQSGISGLVYVRQPIRLSMRQNFEAGLNASTGSHVVFIGDDDALAPNGFVLLRDMIACGDFDIFKWRIVNYIWPDRDRGRQGSVVLRTNKVSGRVRLLNPQALLSDFITARINGYQSGAMIYHGCISRRLIEKVRGFQDGTYFWTTCPDVYASVANLIHADTDILAVDLPVTIGGSSPRSNGTAGIEYTQSGAIEPTSEHAKFVAELMGDPFLGRTPATCPSVNLVTIDALQLAHRCAGRPLKLDEVAWLERVEPELRGYPAHIASDARDQAALVLASLADTILAFDIQTESKLVATTPPLAPRLESSANIAVSLAKVKISGGTKMNGIAQAVQVIDEVCAASTPLCDLPTTIFGSVVRVGKMLWRAHSTKGSIV